MQIAVHAQRGEADIDAVHVRQPVTNADNGQQPQGRLALRRRPDRGISRSGSRLIRIRSKVRHQELPAVNEMGTRGLGSATLSQVSERMADRLWCESDPISKVVQPSLEISGFSSESFSR
jgi:hypothetical protein